MGSILIVDNQQSRNQRLARYLSEAGHRVSGIRSPVDLAEHDYSKFDLAIVNLYPDAGRTWELYRKFKHEYPELPVLVYVENSFDAFRSLKQVIASILGDSPPVGQYLLSRRMEAGRSACSRC